ncbi:hypothetical protein FDECE_11088 [Fusarium decemcellulare]|nr:hypothetical protein FDECE_11088 [Fusarium decemcellulare]
MEGSPDLFYEYHLSPFPPSPSFSSSRVWYPQFSELEAHSYGQKTSSYSGSYHDTSSVMLQATVTSLDGLALTPSPSTTGGQGYSVVYVRPSDGMPLSPSFSPSYATGCLMQPNLAFRGDKQPAYVVSSHERRNDFPSTPNYPVTPAKEPRVETTCAICETSFGRTADLDRHYLKHTGKRAHKCEACNKTFGRRDHLVRHQRKGCISYDTSSHPDRLRSPPGSMA